MSLSGRSHFWFFSWNYALTSLAEHARAIYASMHPNGGTFDIVTFDVRVNKDPGPAYRNPLVSAPNSSSTRKVQPASMRW
jgi:hypothetical protein